MTNVRTKLEMLDSITKLIATKDGIILLIGVICGVGLAWQAVLPRMVDDRTAIINEQKQELQNKFSETSKKLADGEAAIANLKAELEKVRKQLIVNPISSVIFKAADEAAIILDGLGIQEVGSPQLSSNGSFRIEFTNYSLFGPHSIVFTDSKPYNFEWKGKFYHLVVEPLPEHDRNRIKVSVFNGPSPRSQ